MAAGDKYFKDEMYVRMAFGKIASSKSGKIEKENLKDVLNTFQAA